MRSIFACGLFCLCSIHAEQIQLTLSRLELKNAQALVTTHQGKAALKLTEAEKAPGEAFASIKNIRFQNGAIELEVSGAPLKTAPDFACGFIGVVFRMQSGGSRYENIYIRPSNGREEDRLRRNHATQYVSFQDWPWERLRKLREPTNRTPTWRPANGRACASSCTGQTHRSTPAALHSRV